MTLDETFVEQLRSDYRSAPISDAERVMLDYSVAVTKDATSVTRADIDALRTHGFDDRAILQITLITAWFNYINRVADALGVGRDAPTGVTLPIPPEPVWSDEATVVQTELPAS